MIKKEANMAKQLMGNFHLGQFIKSSRPISWVNTASPFVAGYMFTGGSFNSYFVLATLYFLIPYNFLIYVVNDVFDYESDLRNPRKNSIEGGLLPPETHKPMLLATLVINLPLLAYLLINGNQTLNIALALIIFGAISYSVPPLRFKEKPFLDSINSSFHFVSPLVFALILNGWNSEYLIYVAIFFAWGLASHAFGAVQDIIPDREAKISSIATFLGAKITVRICFLLYVFVALSLLLLGLPSALLVVPALGYALMVWPYINLEDKQSKQANGGWKHFLVLNQFTGFVITMILIFSL